MSKHPIQPLELDKHGTLRFKANAIVEYLLEKGGITMNDLAILPFEQNDREQFAQLIGYSLGGYSELSYVSNETYNTAEKMYNKSKTEDAARIESLRDEVVELQDKLARIRQILEE